LEDESSELTTALNATVAKGKKCPVLSLVYEGFYRLVWAAVQSRYRRDFRVFQSFSVTRMLMIILRIGAAICVALAGLTFFMGLFGGSFSQPQLIVSQKYTNEIQFRLMSEVPYPQRGFTFDTTVSRAFYDAAETGDELSSPLTGYFKLVRDGRIVARYFSPDFIAPAVYSFVALLPAVAFLRLDRLWFRRFVLPVLGLIEAAVMVAFLYATFASCC